MKKFLCIFLISCFFFSSLVVSSFAEETITITFHNLTNSAKTVGYRVFGTEDYQQIFIPANSTGSISFSLGTVYQYANYGSGYLSTNPLTSSLADFGSFSTNSSDPTVLYSTLTDIYIGLNSSSLSQYFTFITPPDPVGDGVGSQVGFVGQIINFISGNTFIVTLVGLSVAMCFVVPFGIRKLKGLIKGY